MVPCLSRLNVHFPVLLYTELTSVRSCSATSDTFLPAGFIYLHTTPVKGYYENLNVLEYR